MVSVYQHQPVRHVNARQDGPEHIVKFSRRVQTCNVKTEDVALKLQPKYTVFVLLDIMVNYANIQNAIQTRVGPITLVF